MNVRIEVEYNLCDQLAARVDELPAQIVGKATMDTLALGMEDSPFDTGNLRDSHTPAFSDDGLRGEVNVGAEYGLYVHEGHATVSGGYVAGRPWLAQAAEHHRDEFNTAMRNVLRQP